MSKSARKKQRTAPQESDVSTETLHNDLHQLAGILPKPVTPFRRAVSAGPTPGSRRTPNIQIRTPGTPRGAPATRAIPTRRAAPTTPHAIRALRERANAARTPGRRRSGRVQRETPRDTLRLLSRTLARESQPVEPSPQIQAQPRNPALDLLDYDDGPGPAAPRLSVALDDMYEDDSFQEAPPRHSLLPELLDDADNNTMNSLEFGRRAFSEDPRTMFSARMSERFGDLSELGIIGEEGEEYEMDGIFINRRPTADRDQLLQDAIDDLGVFGEEDEPDEPTFRFNIPQRIRAPEQDEPLFVDQDDEEAEAETEAGAEMDDGVNAGLDEDQANDEATTGGFENVGWESDHDEQEDAELQAYREEVSAVDRSLQTQSPERASTKENQKRRQRRPLNISKAGHEYPSFPAATVKRLASGLAKSQSGNAKINKDTLAALVQATDWFFEQVGEDLAAYSQHAGRKVIEESDVIALMKRQRQITNNTTAFSLAQKLLPRELLQELRMQPVGKLKRQKRKRMEAIQEESEDD